MADYRTEHARSIEDPEGYWAEQAGLVDWIKKPQRVLDDDHPPFYRWFPDATLNTCYNALDRHVVRGHGDRTALIYDSAVAGTEGTKDLHLRASCSSRWRPSPVRCAVSAWWPATGW